MLRSTCLLIFSLLAFTICQFKINSESKGVFFPKEDGVITLTPETIDEFFSTYQYTFVELYAYWCPHCIRLAPEFAKAAVDPETKRLGVVFAKVDVAYYPSLQSRFNIRGFPVIRLYKNGKTDSYDSYPGSHSADKLVSWLKKALISPTEIITTTAYIREHYEKPKDTVNAIYFGTNETNIKKINEFALEDEDHRFGLVSDKKLISSYGAKLDTLVAFTPYDDRKDVFTDEYTTDNIQNFLENNNFPLILNEEQADQSAFKKSKPTLFVLTPPKMLNDNNLRKLLTSLAKEFKGKIRFSIFSNEHSSIKTTIGKLNVTLSDTKPTVVLREYRVHHNNWEFKEELTADKLKSFCLDYVAGKFIPPLKSEPIPTSQDSPVFKLVTDSFKKEVLESDVNFLVKFYAPYCGHCKRLAPAYEELAKKYQGQKDKIIIAEFNSVDNDFLEYEIRGYPTILMWANGKKDKPIEYSGDRSVESFSKFIEANMKDPVKKKEEVIEKAPKKETAEKEAPKKETAEKDTPKKQAPKKEEPKKETAEKETPKKEASKKEAPKKETAEKEAAKKDATTNKRQNSEVKQEKIDL